ADTVVVSVRDQEVAGAVQGNRGDFRQRGRRSRPAIPAGASTGHSGDNAGAGVDPADAKIIRIRDEKISGSVHDRSRGVLQRSGGSEAIVAGKSSRSIARYSGNEWARDRGLNHR